jgi:DNA-binding MarR family transcriptional regulator
MFCRVPDLADRRYFGERARAARLDVRYSIRPPGSPHRLGLPVVLLDPPSPARVLVALSPRPSVQPAGQRRLSPRMNALLSCGDAHHRYRSRSEVILALALAAANASWTQSAFLAAMLDPENAGGQKVQEIAALKGQIRAERYVEGRWRKATARVRNRPAITDRADAICELLRVDVSSRGTPWRGTGGASDWAVLTAHLSVARRTAKLTYDASVREIAEIAGVHASTVSRAHRRLIAGRWLRRSTRRRRLHADTWTLRVPSERPRPDRNTQTSPVVEVERPDRNTQTSPPGGCEECVASSPSAGAAGDAWRWRRGLGKSAQRIWERLLRPRTARDLARCLGVTTRTVQKHLVVLARFDLAVRDGTGNWRRGAVSPDGAAARLGALGIGLHQRLQHQEQRAAYRGGGHGLLTSTLRLAVTAQATDLEGRPL